MNAERCDSPDPVDADHCGSYVPVEAGHQPGMTIWSCTWDGGCLVSWAQEERRFNAGCPVVVGPCVSRLHGSVTVDSECDDFHGYNSSLPLTQMCMTLNWFHL